MNIKKYKKNPLTVLLSILLPLGGLGGLLTSCSDFFEQDSTYIIDAEKDHLNNATDTIYSLTGILNKVQAIADRTILLGEARGDLMTVTDATPADLRAVANFTIGDDNMYNNPLDYYAIINNCNYFIAKADIELKNNRNQFIFKKEYAEVKAIRAWTYLQLVTTYGRVPFVTEPIMTKEESERSYPMYDIKQVCNYFINEDNLQDLVDDEMPDYGIIKSLPSKNFLFPVRLVLADLYLWAENYYEAAKYYHDFIINRNGKSGIYPTTTYSVRWTDPEWDGYNYSWEAYTFRSSVEESTASDNELITMIPMDSIPSEGHYSQLRNIFNSTTQNDYKVSLVPSNKIINLSESQVYCYNDQGNVTYATTTKVKEMTGDLRLSQAWETEKNVSKSTGGTYDYQYIYKYQTKHVHVYRRTLVYLRLAEALNRAGYPRYAFQILSSGVNTEVLQDSIIPHYRADSLKIMEDFNFPGTRLSSISSAYVANSSPYRDGNFEVNTIGIHSRGSGFTPANEYYQMPYNPNITDPAEQLAWQQDKVEEMIIDEEALEFAFEGYRFYDLLRVALRRNDPAWLEKKIQGRNGNAPSGVSVDLKDQNNWFLRWKGRIGF
jgi:hypothetical protein